ncbi:Phosphatidylinositol 3-Kinase Catalytic Subunit Type 3 [Manis pentadactyla]|nr:Phosphatidylinositol 3-Kinase Catalytic Subunit Type 3 [Manis pentadactyla]
MPYNVLASKYWKMRNKPSLQEVLCRDAVSKLISSPTHPLKSSNLLNEEAEWDVDYRVSDNTKSLVKGLPHMHWDSNTAEKDFWKQSKTIKVITREMQNFYAE